MSIYTGSHIGLGIVFSDNQQLEIFNCISFMINKFKSVHYVLTTYFDQNDEDHEYTQEQISRSDIETLCKSDYFTIRFETRYHESQTQILISNALLEDFVAVQIDFHEDSLMKCFCGDYAECLHFMEHLCMELHWNTPFEYAYCDNNADFAYTPAMMKQSGYQKYSLVWFPHGQDLTVIRQHWELDGFTKRKTNLVGNFLLTQTQSFKN